MLVPSIYKKVRAQIYLMYIISAIRYWVLPSEIQVTTNLTQGRCSRPRGHFYMKRSVVLVISVTNQGLCSPLRALMTKVIIFTWKYPFEGIIIKKISFNFCFQASFPLSPKYASRIYMNICAWDPFLKSVLWSNIFRFNWHLLGFYEARETPTVVSFGVKLKFSDEHPSPF